MLAKSPCYKGVQSLVPLKINGLGNDCTELNHIMTAKYYLFFFSPSPPFLPPSLSLSLSSAALAACTYLSEMRERIFGALYKAINSNSVELQNAGKEAMRKVHMSIAVKYSVLLH